MRIRGWMFASMLAVISALLLGIGASGATAAGFDFEFNGGLYYEGSSQTFTVPNSVNRIVIDADGASGGGSYGVGAGLGAEAVAAFTFPAADEPGAAAARQLQINVGGRGAYLDDEEPSGYGGWNGGGYGLVPSYDGFGDGYGGGGASDVRNGGFGLANRMVVAGGGGGGYANCPGGDGGAPIGGNGCAIAQSGTGGGTSSGGYGGVGSRHGGAGATGQGGYGGSARIDNGVGQSEDYAGSGGGGGYYGGGGGALDVTSTDKYYGAGGGGSSYTPDGTGMTAGVNEGSGSVSIFYASIDSVTPNASKVALGQPMRVSADNALLGPTGQMTATLYGPGNPDCSTDNPYVPGTQMGGPDADDTYTSGDFTPTELGTYQWVVSYSGDDRYDTVTSPCQAGTNVVQVVPRAPTGLTATPASPSNVDTPKISGTADAGSSVSLFTSSDCSGTPVATESATLFASPGIPVDVNENSTNTFHATATNGGESFCSTDSVTYVEDSVAPEAEITSQPSTPTNSPTATFAYSSTKAGSTFECELDAQDFISCPVDGITYSDLTTGSHTFSVRAIDPAGNGSALESFTWSVDRTAPTVTLSSTPKALANSTTATFAYSSDKTGSSFECSLDQDGFNSCPAAETSYSGLADGQHTFRIRATDPLGNVSPVVTFPWTIDLTPPQTTILSQPPGNSTSATAAFTYSSTENGSAFECSLDVQSFTACPGTGITYPRLSDGAHTFSVRSTDVAGNTGPAAAYSWTIDTIPPPNPPAAIGKVTVTGPARVKRAKPVTYRVKVANPGGAAAQGVKLRVAGKGVKARKPVGLIAAGTGKTVAVKLKPSRAGRIKLTFKVTSANAGGRTAKKTITVRP